MTKSKLLTTPKPLTLRVNDFQRVHLTLVGCGGTGSHIASGLIAIAQALGERGIGADLLFIDPDTVEEKNVGRQLFAAGDVGRPKAEALAERLNAAFGARCGAAIRAIDGLDTFVAGDYEKALNIVIGAVDNVAARAIIAKAVDHAKGRLWWLDCGNENHSGQIMLGNITDKRQLIGAMQLGLVDRLPAPSLMFPDLVRARRVGRNKGQSCAELTEAGEQGLTVNRMVAAWACAMLYDFLVARSLAYFALAFELKWGGTRTWQIDIPSITEVTGLTEAQLTGTATKTRKTRRN